MSCTASSSTCSRFITKSCFGWSVILAISCCLFADDHGRTPAGRDPGGWTNARWGMTEAEILQALPGQAVRLEGIIPIKERTFNGVVARIGVPRLDLGKHTFRIFFICDPALRRVMMQADEASPEAFIGIEALLVQRYGYPWVRSRRERMQSLWSFATTAITLRYVDLRAVAFRSLWLTYERKADPPQL